MDLRRAIGALSAVFLVLFGLSGQSFATHGGLHGHCENGKPVIEYWPDEYKDYHAECMGNVLTAVPNKQIEPPPPLEWMEEPEDFYSWVYVYLNGKLISNPYRDIDPFIKRSTGRTLVPIRMITEAMGGTAEWNSATSEVTIRLRDKYMLMKIGAPEAVANGQKVTLDQPPILLRDRTMVPLRVVLEAFGADVKWTEASFRVDLTLAGVECDARYCK